MAEEIVTRMIEWLSEEVLWIDANFRGYSIPTSGVRTDIAQGCYDLAVEYQSAILLLARAKSYGAIFALLRIMFEALIRGLWIESCATDEEVSGYIKKGEAPPIRSMLVSIDEKLGDEIIPLKSYFERLRKHLHDFTHTGVQHISRRHANKRLGPNYTEKDLSISINLAALVGLQAALRFAQMASDEKNEGEIHRRLVDYAKRYSQLDEFVISSARHS